MLSIGIAAFALQAHWRASPSHVRPSPPRSGHVSSPDGRGGALLFGGYAEESGKERAVVNDLWRYTHNSGWQQEATGATRPGPRLCSASALTSDGSSLLLFGGWDPQKPGTGGEILSDVWKLDINSKAWQRLEHPMARGPTSRHVAANVGGLVIVHTFRCSSSVLVFDEEAERLVEQSTHGKAPSARGLHAAAAVGHHLVVFGGAAQSGEMCNDIHALDTRTWEWRELTPKGRKAPAPSARAGACAASVGSAFVVACGAERGKDGGLEPRADVWSLELGGGALRGAPGQPSWTRLLDDTAEGAPAPRNAATLTALGGGELLCHGGWRPFVKTFDDSRLLRVESA